MKRILSILLTLLLVFGLTACGSKKEEEKNAYVYYLYTEGQVLEQQAYPLQATDYESKIKELLKALKDTPESIEYMSAIPKEVEVESFLVGDKQLELHFNDAYLQVSKNAEVLMRAAIVQTMVQIEGIDYVSFYVGEEPLSDYRGNPVGLMSSESFVQNTGFSLYSYQTTPLKLYFSDADGVALESETKNEVRYSVNTSIEKLVVEQLMKGPSSSKHTPTIPNSVTLLGVSVNEGICYVNFSSSFLTDGYNQNPEVTIYSIVNSIIENGSVLKVQFLIEGAQDAVFMNLIDLSKPLEWNAEIIKE